ncbi:hypothetical protein [Streptomyces mexicanus]|jgi:hypothetical protein|uniref:hypothetical protein n=1 Tax=Streptomyces mexicanus TaxID=178566 RepID=UPI003666AD10
MKSPDRISEGHGENTDAPLPDTRALHWAQFTLSAGGLIAAIVIWALGAPPLVAGAVATAAAGSAGWHVTVHVRR